MVLRSATSLLGALEGVGPENLDFLGLLVRERVEVLGRAGGLPSGPIHSGLSLTVVNIPILDFLA
jgi:hypothetical protein